jgi:hypothetical protein
MTLRITFWSILFKAAVADHLLEHALLGRVTESKLAKSESKLGKS